jgi:hypothetical protein
MKIIERGIIPGDREWRAMCGSCKTRFEFTEKEGQVHDDQRDGRYIVIGCPVCSKTCYGSPK